MSVLPVKNADIAEQRIGDELMLADPSSGRVHVLNPTAACVWSALDAARTDLDIARVLNQSMAVPAGVDLAGIVRRTLQLLESKGLVRYT